jgi:hypothetical protein
MAQWGGEALLDAAAARLTDKAIELALEGDGVALRFCLGRILAPRRFNPVELDLPPLETQQDLALALAAVSHVAAAGEISSEQAMHIVRVLDATRRALEARNAEYAVWGRLSGPPAPPTLQKAAEMAAASAHRRSNPNQILNQSWCRARADLAQIAASAYLQPVDPFGSGSLPAFDRARDRVSRSNDARSDA